MRRKYTKAEYKAKIDHIRRIIPLIAITTDVIVGFPGETDEMFEEMEAFIKELAFSELHVFPYSKRSGTKAAKRSDHINGIIKSIRVNRLLELNEELASEYIQSSKSNDVSVIFETSDERYTYGHSDTYIKVKTDKDETLHNQLRSCQIIRPKYKDTYVQLKRS